MLTPTNPPANIETVARAMWLSDQEEIVKSFPDHKRVDWDSLGHREDANSNYQVYMRRAKVAIETFLMNEFGADDAAED